MRQKSFRETGGVSVLGRRDRWSATAVYGAAHYGKSLFWYGGEVLFAFFLTEVAGLTPAHMAGVLAIGFLISAIFDLQPSGWAGSVSPFGGHEARSWPAIPRRDL